MFVSDSEWDMILRALLLGPIALVWIIITVRVIGLRAFSKMAAFDFAVTVAIGSLLAMAATATDWIMFGERLLSMTALLFAQFLIAKSRLNSRLFSKIVSNDPLILMRNGKFDDDALHRARVTRDDVIAKMREANALRFDDVAAVILETTGDISVLHGSNSVDDKLLEPVRD